MRWSAITTIALGAVSAHHITNPWQSQNFKTLVTFGDSYTDENRLSYFGSHNGSAPPAGMDLGVVRQQNPTLKNSTPVCGKIRRTS